MKLIKTLLSLSAITLLVLTACNKEELPIAESNLKVEENILKDFANVLVFPNYVEINSRAASMNSLVQAFAIAPSDSLLSLIRQSWKDTRKAWELSESYLFGPVEDFNYDPMMDDWPINHVDLDSLLATTTPLSPSDIVNLPTSLKGFHPIEYLIFGISGTRNANQFTTREIEYLSSLSENLFQVTSELKNSWDPSLANNFSNELITAGNGSVRFTTRKEAFITIVNAMVAICDEVANGKMEEPFVAQDSLLEESQFSHNSLEDFTNNIRGVKNAYLCTYYNDGIGLNELVSVTNLALDNSIRTKIESAILSFSTIDSNYGRAIYTNHIQILNTQAKINDLKATLETDLINFINTTIKD